MKRHPAAVFVLLVLVMTGALARGYGEGPSRPKVGVVLSGGGAKGFAHVALLRKLEELRIPVDYIGGTSMGATVAALYAMGYTPDELERVARETDWFSMFSERSERKDMDLFQRHLVEEFPLSIDITNGSVSPKGFVRGQKISMFLSRLAWGHHSTADFNAFRVPFLCIGTDVETGGEKIFTGGDIVNVLRSTMAIPTVFEPVEIDGRIYLDGGIVNNFPVKQVKDRGADIVIGMDVGAPLYGRKELDSLPKIMEQLISFNGVRENEKQRARCDVLITPDLPGLSAMSFDKTDEILKAGEKAVAGRSARLAEIASLFPSPSPAPAAERGTKLPSVLRIDAVKFQGRGGMKSSVLRAICPVKKGETVSIDDIENAVRGLYGHNYYRQVGYRIDSDGEQNVLRFQMGGKMERRLFAGFSYDNYMDGAIRLGLEANGVLLDNAKLLVRGRLGKYGKIDAGYYLVTSVNPGVTVIAHTQTYRIAFTENRDTPRAVQYDFWHHSSSLGAALFPSKWLGLFSGARSDVFFIETENVEGDKREFKTDNAAFFAAAKADTFNSLHFPESGILYEAEVDYVRPDFSFNGRRYEGPFWQTTLNTRLAVPLPGPLSLGAGFSAGFASQDDVPPAYLFALGGLQRYEKWTFPLAGYAPMERTGQHGWVYQLSLQCRLFKNWYLIPRWNEGKVSGAFRDAFRRGDTLAGYGVSLGYDFFLGPMETGVFRKREDGDYTFYFNFGFVY